jgi:uncharacterized DUF497 family protein
MEFVWNRRNIDHIAKHGISPREAEYVVMHARPPYPEMVGEEKRQVVGKLDGGDYIQVIYVPSRSVVGGIYIMHSGRLTEDEKRRFRRRRK